MKLKGIKIVSYLVVFLLIFTTLVGSSVNVNASEAEIAISTPEDLEKLRYSSEGVRYYLTNDINMNYYGLWEPIEEFKGILDGNGYIIKGLTSNKGGLIDKAIGTATIKKIVLEDVSISVVSHKTSDEGGISLGAIAAESFGVIKQCSVSGTIKLVNTACDGCISVGGIVGDQFNRIDECANYASVEIDSSNLKFFMGTCYVGGIVGSTWGEIYNCINEGNVAVYNRNYTNEDLRVRCIGAGGIAGAANSVLNCCSMGKVTADFYPVHKNEIIEGWAGSGTILAYAGNNTYTYGCYETSGNPFGVNDNSTAEANYISSFTKETFKEFDFNSIWSFDSGIEENKIHLQWMQPYIQLPSPYPDMKSGTYENGIKVDLYSPSENAIIYYTLDGSTPTKKSLIYSNQLNITANTTIKMFASYEKYKDSEVVTYNYKIKAQKSTTSIKTEKKASYKKAYQKVIKSSTSPRKYTDFSYEDRYFRKKVKFDKYFTYDLDKNGIPELFVHSKTTGMWAVFTYDDGKAIYLWNDYFGINKKTKALIVHGHWHGAGGTWNNEYSIYKIKNGKELVRSYYIDDQFGHGYVIGINDEYEEENYTKENYDAVYVKYVKKTTSLNKFKSTKVGSYKGIK